MKHHQVQWPALAHSRWVSELRTGALDSTRIHIWSPPEPRPDVFIRVTLATQALHYPYNTFMSTYAPLRAPRRVGNTVPMAPAPRSHGEYLL